MPAEAEKMGADAVEARDRAINEMIGYLCPHHYAGHLLDNGRVWGFCGATMHEIPEGIVAEALGRQR